MTPIHSRTSHLVSLVCWAGLLWLFFYTLQQTAYSIQRLYESSCISRGVCNPAMSHRSCPVLGEGGWESGQWKPAPTSVNKDASGIHNNASTSSCPIKSHVRNASKLQSLSQQSKSQAWYWSTHCWALLMAFNYDVSDPSSTHHARVYKCYRHFIAFSTYQCILHHVGWYSS